MDRRAFLKVFAAVPVAAAAVTAQALPGSAEQAFRPEPKRLPGQDYAVYFEGRIVAYATLAEIKRRPESDAEFEEWLWVRFGIRAKASTRIPVARINDKFEFEMEDAARVLED